MRELDLIHFFMQDSNLLGKLATETSMVVLEKYPDAPDRMFFLRDRMVSYNTGAVMDPIDPRRIGPPTLPELMQHQFEYRRFHVGKVHRLAPLPDPFDDRRVRDRYFLAKCMEQGHLLSEDPERQVCAILVNDDTGEELGLGVNTRKVGADGEVCRDEQFDHGEFNCLKALDAKGVVLPPKCVMYISHIPCPKCVELILARKEIVRVVYPDVIVRNYELRADKVEEMLGIFDRLDQSKVMRWEEKVGNMLWHLIDPVLLPEIQKRWLKWANKQLPPDCRVAIDDDDAPAAACA